VFACSGALAAGLRRMDLFGVVVPAFVTAVGGGTLRDLVLGDSPMFWVRDALYIWVAVGAGLVTFAAVHLRRIGLDQTGPGVIAAMTGVMSAVVGGIVHDMLVNRAPLILRREIYASAAVLGTVVLQVLDALGMQTSLSAAIAGTMPLLLRLAAVRWQLHLPSFPRRN
jgi:uncharacterized membrane protein YeiH